MNLGLQQPWLEGEEYLSIVDEFMEAIHTRWPKAIVQFEDFQMKWAFERLQRYQKRFCMFNNDIQGTAGVALAGLLGTVRAQDLPLTDFVDQKIVVVRAGRGLVFLTWLHKAVSRMAGAGANPLSFLLDKDVWFYKWNNNFKKIGLHSLSSLTTLRISGGISVAEDEEEEEEGVAGSSFPIDGKLLPTSLIDLQIGGFRNLEKLSSKLFQSLTSLEYLQIWHIWISGDAKNSRPYHTDCRASTTSLLFNRWRCGKATTNGRVHISFQLGAFVPGYPVHPVIVCYPLVHFDQSGGNIALGKLIVDMIGTGIPIGKLDMYVAAAGINPQRIWDFSTLGWKEMSIYQLLMNLWRQFTPWAFERLQRYQKRFCMFNDDMQGTAGVGLAGLLGTVRAQGRPLTNFVNQKIVVVGARSAGLGVFNMATQTVSRMAGAEASPQFFLLDEDGLITTERKGAGPATAPFAKAPGEIKGLGLREGANLVEVVKRVKPHVLLGLSGVGGIFNEQSECTAIDAFNHAGENIVFASGSPFKNIDLGNGKVGHVKQANNMYLFPRLDWDGSSFLRCSFDFRWNVASSLNVLASYITEEEIQSAILYPPMRSIRDITAEVGAAVVRAVVVEELAKGRCDVGPRELR
ncbi:unnamed protein product [Camellia sinensis]